MSDSTPNDRTLTWWPIVGAAVIAAIVAVVIVVVGGGDERPGTKRDDDGALACPSAYHPDTGRNVFWVPTNASGVDGKESLAPDTTPSHVTICEFTATKSGQVVAIPLSGHRKLTTGSADLARRLSKLPKSKGGTRGGQVAGESMQTYLVGLTVATGYVWVAVPGVPIGASNGQFVTNERISGEIAAAYRTGAWTG